MATDCLAGYIYSLKKDGDDIPNASSINDISLKEVAKQLEADTEGILLIWYLLM